MGHDGARGAVRAGARGSGRGGVRTGGTAAQEREHLRLRVEDARGNQLEGPAPRREWEQEGGSSRGSLEAGERESEPEEEHLCEGVGRGKSWPGRALVPGGGWAERWLPLGGILGDARQYLELGNVRRSQLGNWKQWEQHCW